MSPHPDAARSRTLLLPLLLTILGFVLPQTAGAFSAPALLKDINPGSAASTPTLLQPFGSKLFFLASDATTGTEAWVSDGTAAGTFELRDILPGAGSGLNPNGLGSVTAVIGGTVYFVAYDGTAGYQLWRTDGTTLGTSKVDAVDNAFGLNVIGGKVFFTNSNSALCVRHRHGRHRRHRLLPGQRRVQRHRVVAQQWHASRHCAGQGHQSG
jgi:ELWxxDGT repeat protein